jgi:hypothetical protein
MADLRVPIAAVTKDITMHVEVTGVRVWRVRLWLWIQLLRLAALVAGVGIQFHGAHDNGPVN